MNNHVLQTRWLYILRLKQEKYYIGITSQKYPYARIAQHKNGFYSAQWVKKYGFDSLLEIRNLGEIALEDAKEVENKITLEYMNKYGKDNVRGGVFYYSGIYKYRFGRFFRETDWEVLTVIILLELIILYLILEKYGIIRI